MKRLSTFLFALILLPTVLLAQERVILRSNGQVEANGVVLQAADGNEIQPVSAKVNARINKLIANGTLALADTLFNVLPATGNSNFGFFGQDWFVQWFVAPADMTIKAAGYNTNATDDPALGAELKLVKMAWTEADLLAAGATATHWGYYEAAGNGFNDATAFMDNPDVTGGWVDKEGSGKGSPFGADLWADAGAGAPVTPAPTGAVNTWQFVEMILLGFEPAVLEGEIIGVAMKNTSPNMDADRIGMLANNTLGIGGFKLYANGRLDTGVDFGWWSRLFTWDFALAVDITGNTAPTFDNVTNVLWDVATTSKTISATITDENPGGGATGVSSATLQYSVNGGAFVDVAMTNTSGDVYEGTIPGQSAGTSVEYKLKASDPQGKEGTFRSTTYGVVAPAHTGLMFFTGLGDSRMNQLAPFYTQGVMGDYDLFNYNAASIELLNSYDQVIEMGTAEQGPSGTFNNQVNIAAWIAGGDREYMMMGDEFLGYLTNWTDSAFVAGDFEYDVLGLSQSYNDIIANTGAGVLAVQTGTDLGDSLAALVSSLGVDTLVVDPATALGSSASNWLDGFELRGDLTGAQEFMKGTGTNGTERTVGASHTTNGDNVVFMAYDALGLYGYRNAENDTLWVANSTTNPFAQAVVSGFLTKSITGLSSDNEVTPSNFKLSQNYPNPFNPSTTIKFSIPTNEIVSLKIYDVLGKEVATLLNETLNAGAHTFKFDASKLSSGMYIYQIKAGKFVSSKKMMLLK